MNSEEPDWKEWDEAPYEKIGERLRAVLDSIEKESVSHDKDLIYAFRELVRCLEIYIDPEHTKGVAAMVKCNVTNVHTFQSAIAKNSLLLAYMILQKKRLIE